MAFMFSFRFPWHRKPETGHPELREPRIPSAQLQNLAAGNRRFHVSTWSSTPRNPVTATSASGTDTGTGSTPRVLRKTLPEKATGSHAIFDLIGTSFANAGTTGASRPVEGSGVAKDLVTSLQAQYWRALDDPQASLAGEWINSPGELAVAGSPVSAMPDAAADKKAETTGSAESAESIETLLSSSRRLEDFFGALGELGPTFMGIKPVPEVLQLFAPPEYRAALEQHPSAMPPELTRREHHEPGIDSPLRAIMEHPVNPSYHVELAQHPSPTPELTWREEHHEPGVDSQLQDSMEQPVNPSSFTPGNS